MEFLLINALVHNFNYMRSTFQQERLTSTNGEGTAGGRGRGREIAMDILYNNSKTTMRMTKFVFLFSLCHVA